MKSFLVFLIFCSVVDYSLCIQRRPVKLPQEASNIMMDTVQRCVTQTGVSFETLLPVLQGGYSEDKKFRDFIYCSYKTAGFLKPDGHLNTEKSIALFRNEPEVVEGIKRCSESPGKNAKEALFNYFKCFQDTVPVLFTL